MRERRLWDRREMGDWKRRERLGEEGDERLGEEGGGSLLISYYQRDSVICTLKYSKLCLFVIVIMFFIIV